MSAPKDDLRLLVAKFRANGGKVSTNVINGHNLTWSDGREVRLAGTREPGPNRDRLLQILRNEAAAQDRHEERLQAARALAEYELGDPSWADVIIDAYREA